MCAQWPPFFWFYFCSWVSKKHRILHWFQIRLNNWKKCTQKKLFARNFCETVIEGDKHSPYYAQLFWSVTFLPTFLLYFSQRFWNQLEIMLIFGTQVQILIIKVLGPVSTLFKPKSNSQARPQNIKTIWKKGLRIFFFLYTYIPVNSLIFSKNMDITVL